MDSTAKIYMRRNGEFGSSCNGIEGTGHTIHEDSGRFTVWSIADVDEPPIIAENATKREAEEAIARDWEGA